MNADHSDPPARHPVRTFLRDNGLTLVLGAAFLLSFCGMLLSGWIAHNAELAKDGQPLLSLLGYLASPDFLSAVSENWESEFLQMATYVVATAFLFQRGSAESDDPDNPDEDPSPPPRSLGDWLRQYSLGLVLGCMFLLSFGVHWLSSAGAAAAEAARRNEPPLGLVTYLGDAHLWFESFQNWQSEFLSTAVLVVLSIFLRFRGSPESKHVGAPHSETGR